MLNFNFEINCSGINNTNKHHPIPEKPNTYHVVRHVDKSVITLPIPNAIDHPIYTAKLNIANADARTLIGKKSDINDVHNIGGMLVPIDSQQHQTKMKQKTNRKK